MMNEKSKKETERKIAIMQAFANGEPIEMREYPTSRYDVRKWRSTPNPTWNWGRWEYRVKPKPPKEYILIKISPTTLPIYAYTKEEFDRDSVEDPWWEEYNSYEIISVTESSKEDSH